MKKILIFNAFYWPGFKSGGPQQTIMNLVDTFGDKAQFFVITQNHDYISTDVYSGVKSDAWNKVGKAQVFYSSSPSFSFRFLLKMTKGYDAIYLCEPYRDHSWKTLILQKLGLIHSKIYLAPMGCFSIGALNQKRLKKEVFWKVFEFLKLGSRATWSFTSEMERKLARRLLSEEHLSNYIIAMDLPKKYVDLRPLRKGQLKKQGEAKLVYLSRVHPHKNLALALEVLSHVKSKIQFDIYGPIEQEAYWHTCQERIKTLPKNITCRYCGEVKPENVPAIFSSYDGFIFLTLGENFGHVIYEALLAGCVPILSDTTPWSKLEGMRCGFVSPLADRNAFIQKVESLANFNQDEMQMYQENAFNYAKIFYKELMAESGYLNLLDSHQKVRWGGQEALCSKASRVFASFSLKSNLPSFYPSFFGIVPQFGSFSPVFNKAHFTEIRGALCAFYCYLK